jgi:hypothetical protein
MKPVSPDYVSAYNKRDEAMDKYKAASTNLPEYKDFLKADTMRDARLAAYIAAREALPEFAEMLRASDLLQIAYKNGLRSKGTP